MRSANLLLLALFALVVGGLWLLRPRSSAPEPAGAAKPSIEKTLAPVAAPEPLPDGSGTVVFSDVDDPDAPRLERTADGKVTITNVREDPQSARIERGSDGSVTISNRRRESE